MKDRSRFLLSACLAAGTLLAGVRAVGAQVTPAAGYTPPDDTPKINVGVTIFADYSYQEMPTVKDSAGNTIHLNSFNITRSYINVTGSFSHWFSFRVTPDVVADNTPTDGLFGRQLFRLKYAYGQVNFDDFLEKGSWFRFGLQQTPWIDYDESVYRYRFQSPTFTDVEGILISSDYGATARVTFPQNYGDVHFGVYNGEGYQSLNDFRGTSSSKGFMVRGSLRPLPGVPIWKGIRIAGFYDNDHYLPNAQRYRSLANVTFENPYVNAGFEYVWATDKTTPTATEVGRSGYSAWVAPRTPIGIEGLFRFDHLDLNTKLPITPVKERLIAGIAYWPALQGGKSVAFMFDFTQVEFKHQTPLTPKSQIYAAHTLWNF